MSALCTVSGIVVDPQGAPAPGACLDGTSTAVDVYLNSCLNADATGVEALTFSGTITLTVINHGDN